MPQLKPHGKKKPYYHTFTTEITSKFKTEDTGCINGEYEGCKEKLILKSIK